MSGKKLLLDAYANRKETWIDDSHLTGEYVIKYEEDCDPYIEEAKRISDEAPGKEFRHAAIIPHFVYAQAIREGWHNDNKKWKQWANNPENRMFRTWPGKL